MHHGLSLRRQQSLTTIRPFRFRRDRKCDRRPWRPSSPSVCRASSSDRPSGSPDAVIWGPPERVSSFLAGLTVICLGVSVVALLAPEQLFRASLTAEGVALVRCAAISIWPVTTIYFVLEDATRHSRLGSDTYKRLGVAAFLCTLLLGFNAGKAIAIVMNTTDQGLRTPLWSPQHYVWMGTLLLAGAVNQMPSQVRPNQVLKLLLPGRSGKGLFWWAVALASPLIAWIPSIFAQAAGGTSQDLWGLSIFTWRAVLSSSVIPSLLASGCAALTLKDAAQRDRLGGSTFKLLRWSLGAVLVGWGALYINIVSLPDSLPHRASFWVLAALATAVFAKWLKVQQPN